MRIRSPWGLLITAVVAASAAVPAGAAAQSPPDGAEQVLVYELNRARWDPAGFQSETGADMSGVLPRPPLAVDEELTASARFKSAEMDQYSYFAHQSPVTGVWPNGLARSFGYALPAGLSDDANNIESLHWGSPVPFNVLKSFAYSPAHRYHLFGEGWFGNATQIGVGHSGTSNYWTVHTAFEDPGDPFITGTVFDDADGDGRLDPGEGLAGVPVEIGPALVVLRGNGAVAVSDEGGAWALQVDSGRYFVRVGGGGGFDGPAYTTVRVTRWNVGVDFVSGERRPTVRAYALCAGLEPTILGTAGDDVLVGTDGADVIHGLAGDDVIDGLDGRDVICGGSGDDVVKGRGGRDTLFGQYGADVLIGGGNTDRVNGGAGFDECSTAESVRACESSS